LSRVASKLEEVLNVDVVSLNEVLLVMRFKVLG